MKNVKFYLFLILIAIQLYVPAQMIWGQEKILTYGKAFKFKTAPIDPNDPFRGKYIWLSFEENEIEVDTTKQWVNQQTVYLELIVDENGFAKISNITSTPPEGNVDYLKSKIAYYNDYKKPPTVIIEYPFNRFYMEESKAFEAEQTYVETQRDSFKVAYALVYIKDGNSVLKNVILDGVPIKEVVEKARLKENK